ncbi:hypothetical protein FRC14_007557 [Serendipita sp. 396]|nr:hypothetical protein FRC14_007557 [Serendipita sp. 396]
MPKLRVLAGPSANELTPISHIVNTFQTHRIKSNRFDGEICVHIKGFVDEDGNRNDSAYFDPIPLSSTGTSNGSEYIGVGGHKYGKSVGSFSSTSSDTSSVQSSSGSVKGGEQRKAVTWSIQVRGRFLVEGLTMDDVLFGNTFDRRLKLPWGSGAALKFMNFVDPTLEHSLSSEKPWALSPLISTMPYFAISHADGPTHGFATPNGAYVQDDTQQLEVPHFKNPGARRQYFSNVSKRREIPIETDDVITTDFCYGFLSFPEIRLNLPGGISFDLLNYWDGQPVRFVCCERQKSDRENGGGGGALKGPGDPFWVVVFQAVLDGEEPTPLPGEIQQTNGFHEDEGREGTDNESAEEVRKGKEDRRRLQEDVD